MGGFCAINRKGNTIEISKRSQPKQISLGQLRAKASQNTDGPLTRIGKADQLQLHGAGSVRLFGENRCARLFASHHPNGAVLRIAESDDFGGLGFFRLRPLGFSAFCRQATAHDLDRTPPGIREGDQLDALLRGRIGYMTARCNHQQRRYRN